MMNYQTFLWVVRILGRTVYCALDFLGNCIVYDSGLVQQDLHIRTDSRKVPS